MGELPALAITPPRRAQQHCKSAPQLLPAGVVQPRGPPSPALHTQIERSALEVRAQRIEDEKKRKRAKQLAMPLHLRPNGANPIDTGCPVEWLSEGHRGLQRPVKMAVDPKWSTELKRINDKIGIRIEYERRLSASIPGSMLPELPYMYPKRHISVPPSPYWVPGKSNK